MPQNLSCRRDEQTTQTINESAVGREESAVGRKRARAARQTVWLTYWLALWFSANVLFFGAGCASFHTTSFSWSNPTDAFVPVTDELSLTNNTLTERTVVLMRTCNLGSYVQTSRAKAIDALVPFVQQSVKPNLLYSLCELCYKEGRRLEGQGDKSGAASRYVQTIVYSYRFLFEPQYDSVRNPYDPAFRDMCLLYNGACSKVLRLAKSSVNQERKAKDDDTMPYVADVALASGNQILRLHTVLKSEKWNEASIEQLNFTQEKLSNLNNRYRQYGIGVPLMVLRRFNQNDLDAKYSPTTQYFPTTILIRPNLNAFNRAADNILPEAGHGVHLNVELYDSVQQSFIMINEMAVPLESDWSSALDASMKELNITEAGTIGLFDPDKLLGKLPGRDRTINGFYLPQPYDPNKIPVVMVHGLWSSPGTWLEMFNTLRTIPEIRRHYQFWFYLYPNGQPFWISAAQLREDLEDIRQTLDPQRQSRKFDQMVLVGHSMGGLVSRMQTIDSGARLWNVVSPEPLESFHVSKETYDSLDSWFHFTYNPSISRVILLATPNLGSSLSNVRTRGVIRTLTRQGENFKKILDDLASTRKEEQMPEFLLDNATSVDSLSAESPFFDAMNECIRSPYVTYYNIVGRLKPSWIDRNPQTDGVVTLDSAHLDGAASEVVVESAHTEITQNPATIMEVGRILINSNPVYR